MTTKPRTPAALVAALLLALSACNLVEQWRPQSIEAYRPVFEQTSRGDVAAVQAALDRDPRLVCAREEDGATLLHDAAQEGQVAVAALLIERGARLEARTSGGLTPLHLAARNGDLPMVELLVGHGARANSTDRRGRTPLDHSVERGHGEVTQWLRAHGGRTGRR